MTRYVVIVLTSAVLVFFWFYTEPGRAGIAAISRAIGMR
jgi:hypothetical protein